VRRLSLFGFDILTRLAIAINVKILKKAGEFSFFLKFLGFKKGQSAFLKLILR